MVRSGNKLCYQLNRFLTEQSSKVFLVLTALAFKYIYPSLGTDIQINIIYLILIMKAEDDKRPA